MSFRLKLFSIVSVGLFCCQIGFSQQLTRSPFSRYGVGDVLNNSTSRNEAMGGIGIASNNYFSLNRLNPASYSDLVFTTMDISGFGQFSTLRSNSSSEEEASAGFQNIFFGFPANSKLALAFGFSPYSVVGYDVSATQDIPYRDTLQQSTVSYIGDGGINQAFLGASVKLLNGKLRIGGNLAYSFGNTRYRTETFNDNDSGGNLVLDLSEEVFVGGFSTQIGVIYEDTLSSKEGPEDILFRLGATTDFNFDLTGDRDIVLNTQGGTQIFTTDTISSTEGAIVLPTQLGVGVNFNQIGKWSLGADLRYQNWSTFRSFGEDPGLDTELRIGLGGEWIPNYQSLKYFPRIHYRAGFFFKNSYVTFEDEPISDIGFTLGLGLPATPSAMDRFNPGRTTSKINLSFTLGRRGSLDTLPLEELYVRVRLGITLNDRWFVKRVVD
ncbi:MAG: hypothetical protein AAF694_02240 [Bacteroidota bacterium]